MKPNLRQNKDSPRQSYLMLTQLHVVGYENVSCLYDESETGETLTRKLSLPTIEFPRPPFISVIGAVDNFNDISGRESQVTVRLCLIII